MKNLTKNKKFIAAVLVLVLIATGVAIMSALDRDDVGTEEQLAYAHVKFNKFFVEHQHADEDDVFKVDGYEYLQFGKAYELSPGIDVVFEGVKTVKTTNDKREIVFVCSAKNTTDEEFEMPTDTALRCGIIEDRTGSSVGTVEGGYWREKGKDGVVLKPGEEKVLTFSDKPIYVKESDMVGCKEAYGYVIGFCAIKIQDTAYYLDFFDSAFEWNRENYSNNLTNVVPKQNGNSASVFEELELGKTYHLEDDLEIVINEITPSFTEDGFLEFEYDCTLTNLSDKDNFVQETFDNNGWISVNDGKNGGIDECTFGDLLKVTSEYGKQVGYVKPNESVNAVLKAEELLEKDYLLKSRRNNAKVSGYYLIVLGDTGCWIDLNDDYILNLL